MSFFPHPEPTSLTERQAGYISVTSRDGVHLVRKDSTAPMLPGMPNMLAEEPGEQAITAAALKAMAPADFADNAEVRAIGGAIRAVTVGALCIAGATFAWAAGYLLLPAVTLKMLPVAWLVAIVATVAYTLASEGTGRRYSAAGVERLKIETAERMHRDRLESREAMHAAATDAWQAVLQSYLDREFRQ